MITLDKYRVNPSHIVAYHVDSEASLMVYLTSPVVLPSGSSHFRVSCDSPSEVQAIIEELEAAIDGVNLVPGGVSPTSF